MFFDFPKNFSVFFLYINYLVSYYLLILNNIQKKYIEDYLYNIKKYEKNLADKFSSYLIYIPLIQQISSFFELILNFSLKRSINITIVTFIFIMLGKKFLSCNNIKSLFESVIGSPYYSKKDETLISKSDEILDNFGFVTNCRERNTRAYDSFISNPDNQGKDYQGEKKEYDSYIIELRRTKREFRYYNIKENGDAFSPANFSEDELKNMYNFNKNLDEELPFFVNCEQYLPDL